MLAAAAPKSRRRKKVAHNKQKHLNYNSNIIVFKFCFWYLSSNFCLQRRLVLIWDILTAASLSQNGMKHHKNLKVINYLLKKHWAKLQIWIKIYFLFCYFLILKYFSASVWSGWRVCRSPVLCCTTWRWVKF